MAFDKIILGVITRTVKSTSRFDIAINSIKTQFDNECPAPQELTKIIQSKNQINQALTQALGALSTINSTAGTINGILTGIDAAITAIKAIPIPSAITPLAPAGIGPSLIPGRIFPALSDSLITLRDFVKTNKGIVNQIPSAISSIQAAIQKTINLLNSLDALILKCLNEQTSNLTPEAKEAYFNQVGFALTQTGNNSNSNINISVNSILEAQLQPNSNNPLIYKDFKLTLEYNNSNRFSFPSRRIKGVNDKTGQIVYNYGGKYSYSSSTEVLFDEIKYQINTLTGTGNVDRELEDATREADNSIRETTRIQLEAQTKQAELTRGKANEALNEANTAAFYTDEARKSAEETAKALELTKTASTIINARESAKETKTAADIATNEANITVGYSPIITEAARKSETAANEAKILSDINPSPESILAAEDANKSADRANKSVEVVDKLSTEVYKLSLEAEDIATKAELKRIKNLEPFGYDGEYDKQIKDITINNQGRQWYYFNNNLAKWIEIPPSNLLPFKTPGVKNNERRVVNGYRLYSYLEPSNIASRNGFFNDKTSEIIEDYATSDVYIWDLETLKWTFFQGNERYIITQRVDGFLRQNASRISKLTNNEIKELKFNGFKNYFTRFEFNTSGNITRI
jgi:hypothetical protein